MVLSESFKLARTAKNLTQTELAKLIGCTKQTISDIERGYRPPSAKIVKAMAECTGCSADEILGVEKKGEDENEEDLISMQRRNVNQYAGGKNEESSTGRWGRG